MGAALDMNVWAAMDPIDEERAGKWADVIAVKGDPLKDITLLQQVPFVMKGGVVYKNEATAAGADKPRSTIGGFPDSPAATAAAGAAGAEF